MKNTDLRVYFSKSVFYIHKVIFLRFIISDKKIQMNPKKIKTILKQHKPESVKSVWSFLRFANFYQQFVEKYLKVVFLLTELTHKDICLLLSQHITLLSTSIEISNPFFLYICHLIGFSSTVSISHQQYQSSHPSSQLVIAYWG